PGPENRPKSVEKSRRGSNRPVSGGAVAVAGHEAAERLGPPARAPRAHRVPVEAEARARRLDSERLGVSDDGESLLDRQPPGSADRRSLERLVGRRRRGRDSVDRGDAPPDRGRAGDAVGRMSWSLRRRQGFPGGAEPSGLARAGTPRRRVRFLETARAVAYPLAHAAASVGA